MTGAEKRALAALLATVVLLFALVEWAHPYYFLQDDNRCQNLPLYAENLRALSELRLPLYNFHQLLGTPLWACIQSAPLYPPNYLALAASRALLGHPFAALDAVALLHLLLAAAGTFRLVRSLGLSAATACFGALAWAFSGFVFAVGNSWIQFTGYGAYLPWSLLFLLSFLRTGSPSPLAALVLSKGVMYSLGYPQVLAYQFLVEGILVAALASSGAVVLRGRAWPLLGKYAAHYGALALLLLPLLLPALEQVASSGLRGGAVPWEEYRHDAFTFPDWIHGVLFPFARLWEGAPSSRNLQYIPHVGLVTAAAAAAAVARLRRDRADRTLLSFAAAAVASYLLSSSETAMALLHGLPVLGRFRWHFKFGLFTSLFLVLVACHGFEPLARWARAPSPAPGRRKALLAAALALHGALFALLYAGLPPRTFGTHRDPLPLEEPLRERLRDGRIASVGFAYYDGNRLDGFTAPSLAYDYATLWDLFQFGGYEVLVSARNAAAVNHLNLTGIIPLEGPGPFDPSRRLPLEGLRAWGVRWYLVDARYGLSLPEGMALEASDPFRHVVRDDRASPLAYVEDGGGTAAWELRRGAVRVAASLRREGAVVVNFLRNPGLRASVDGVPVEAGETPLWQIRVPVPAGEHAVEVAYEDPRVTRTLPLSALVLAALVATWRKGRREGGAGEGAP